MGYGHALDSDSARRLAKTEVDIGVAMLIKGFFEAVERAFKEEAGRTPAPSRLELVPPFDLPLPTVESSEATASTERRHLPERRRLPDRRLPRS